MWFLRGISKPSEGGWRLGRPSAQRWLPQLGTMKLHHGKLKRSSKHHMTLTVPPHSLSNPGGLRRAVVHILVNDVNEFAPVFREAGYRALSPRARSTTASCRWRPRTRTASLNTARSATTRSPPLTRPSPSTATVMNSCEELPKPPLYTFDCETKAEGDRLQVCLNKQKPYFILEVDESIPERDSICNIAGRAAEWSILQINGQSRWK
ncbi:hypothetical protein NHX12_009240 [Muraenolepis orangiensis]|uniref:Cadherin domain-containing protein n=1 Tax=Muraenolepis orangiensis TaxID=630683 RepID=A0A9Q0IA58_9TELE|nr:hypothetical protein NHX12_009240 [Muraenolepis orangiensis]